MRRILIVSLLAVAAAVAVAVPVIAADPATGTVSGAATEATWTGSVTGDPGGLVLAAFGEAGGTGGACDDSPPICDTFTLTVSDPGTKLTVKATAAGELDAIAVSVLDPDGNETYAYDGTTEAIAVLSNPKKGDYVVNVLGSPTPGPFVDYAASAVLEGAAPPEQTATATPTATSTPAPTPEPTPEPAPAAPPQSAPAPPAQAGPRSLSLEPDRRRVKLAARFGFRVRVICHGGCTKVKIRAYVSNLTARNLKLGNFAGDAEVASGRIIRDAEGRRQIVVTFKPSLRRKLARAKSLPLAVEAVATDPDGQVRMFVKRFTLKR
jgi:hypothetical protein